MNGLHTHRAYGAALAVNGYGAPFAYALVPFAEVAQPSNVKPAAGVNAFAVSAVPAFAVWLAIVPVPPFALKDTVQHDVHDHWAYRVMSAGWWDRYVVRLSEAARLSAWMSDKMAATSGSRPSRAVVSANRTSSNAASFVQASSA